MKERLERLAKRALRPFARPLLARLDRRALPFRQDVDALTRHMPVLLDTIASQNASSRESRRDQLKLENDLNDIRLHLEGDIRSLRDRVEFIRQELMYEMRYGAKRPGSGAAPDIEPRIVAPDRIPPDGNVRLNLGCGHIPIPGFVNVDTRDLDHVDVVADVRRLPFPAGSVAQIHSAHLLEHFPLEELRRALLPYWCSLLKPGGLLTAVVPDAEKMIAEYSAGRFSFEDLRLVTFGQQEYDQDFHFIMFSKESLCELLRQAGLTKVRVVASGRRNGVCYEMELEGRWPSARAVATESVDASASGR